MQNAYLTKKLIDAIMTQNKRRYRSYKPYVYTDSISLSASSSGQILFNISSGYDFLLCSWSYVSTTAVANTIPTFDLQIKANDELILNDYCPAEIFNGLMVETNAAPDNLYGHGDQHFNTFDVPYFFTSKQTMIFDVKDTSAQANVVEIVAKGIKLSY